MKAVNLYALTRMQDKERFSFYDNLLSGRIDEKKTGEREQKSLKSFVDSIINVVALEQAKQILEGFYFGYEINHISKEFDLLKIEKEHKCILNVELKSELISKDRIQRQLIQNRYYLSHICNKIYSFTFVSDINKLYKLDEDDNLIESNIHELLKIMEEIHVYVKENIETLFTADKFLISPLNTPEKFINKQYFLTGQQLEIKNKIIDNIKNYSKDTVFISLSGSAGTGKTLLLYDIARECSELGKVCIIHCGILPESKAFLQRELKNISLKNIKDVCSEKDLDGYQFIFVDETHRIYERQFELIVQYTTKNKIFCVFSHDAVQILSHQEAERDIKSKIVNLNPFMYTLSEKIRTNKQLASFILSVLNLNRKDVRYTYDDVDILYANNSDEANELLDYYKMKNYTFINFTSSNYNRISFDDYEGDYNAHKVIGQEFDNVIMIMDSTFAYDKNNKLIAKIHPTHDYMYIQMLFQGLTRTREKLCIIIVDDLELFDHIASIKKK